MSDWLTKPVVTQATEEPKSIDSSEQELTTVTEADHFKRIGKEHRQELKMQCLHAALQMHKEMSGETAANVVATATALYKFVRT